MHLKHIVLIVLVLWKFTAHSQSFTEIKNQVIEIENFSEENRQPFISNVYTFVGNDFDSLDIQILLNGPILGVRLQTKVDFFLVGVSC